MVWLKAWESIRVYENHMKAFGSMRKGVILMAFVSVALFLKVFLVKKRYYGNESFGFSLWSLKSVWKLYKSVNNYLNQKYSFP